MKIVYCSNKAKYQFVFSHLLQCNNNFIPQLSERVSLEHFSNKIIEKAITFEAWENNALIGLVSAYFNDTENMVGYINNVSTIKEFMGNGIASKLLEMCIEYGKEQNFKEIKLEVSDRNFVAIELYKKLGFFKYYRGKNFFIMKCNLVK